MKPRGCWYCDGTVHFDSDGIGDCDTCTETYSADEFIERENEELRKAHEAAGVAHKKQMDALIESAHTCIGIDTASNIDF